MYKYKIELYVPTWQSHNERCQKNFWILKLNVYQYLDNTSFWYPIVMVSNILATEIKIIIKKYEINQSNMFMSPISY